VSGQDEIARAAGQQVPAVGTVLPQYQAPAPLKGLVPSSVKVVHADVPLVSTVSTWTVDLIRDALYSHSYGIFYGSGRLADAILGDDRVMATIGSLTSGLFSREVIIEPADDSAAAKEVAVAWQKAWPLFASTSALNESEAYTTLMGFEAGQIVWDTDKPVWQPYLRPWHPTYEYYHWDLRRYIAISQQGQVVIEPGNGKWILHAPFGDYRGWIRGAVRAVAEPWLMRHWAMRDWARYSEKHGIPIVKAMAPAACEEGQRDAFERAVAQLGSESTILLPQGVDKQFSYNVEYAEPTDDSWQSFPGLIDRCDMSIVLAIMFQNLTTEVKGGSFAATTSHMDIREGGIGFRAEAWSQTIDQQVARPFAWVNFGDPDLAPKTRWDIPKLSEHSAAAAAFSAFGTAIEVLARGGLKFKDADEVRRFASLRFGLKDLPAFDIGDPVQSSGGGGR
jgi:hypothetical protein